MKNDKIGPGALRAEALVEGAEKESAVISAGAATAATYQSGDFSNRGLSRFENGKTRASYHVLVTPAQSPHANRFRVHVGAERMGDSAADVATKLAKNATPQVFDAGMQQMIEFMERSQRIGTVFGVAIEELVEVVAELRPQSLRALVATTLAALDRRISLTSTVFGPPGSRRWGVVQVLGGSAGVAASLSLLADVVGGQSLGSMSGALLGARAVQAFRERRDEKINRALVRKNVLAVLAKTLDKLPTGERQAAAALL